MIEGCKHGPKFLIQQPCADCERERIEGEARDRQFANRIAALRPASAESFGLQPGMQPVVDELRRRMRSEQSDVE